ncbi:hypothetical protein PFISCL1PPCAC_14886, partial [Pristionchus fissidentatus]
SLIELGSIRQLVSSPYFFFFSEAGWATCRLADTIPLISTITMVALSTPAVARSCCIISCDITMTLSSPSILR